jgi:murein DD-endopeptidase MepM/ murein hydrolase activator NlpD
MIEDVRHFPIPARAAIVAALLVLVSVVATVAGAAPSKRDVQRAKERLRAIEADLGTIRNQLAETQLRLHGAAAKVERQQIALEEVQADLVRTQAELDRAKGRYDRIVTRLNDRAAEAYMQGPASSIDFLLGAETVADLTDRIAYVDAMAQSDAELAVKVANLKNRLTVIEDQLEDERIKKARELEKARQQEEAVADLFGHFQSLLDRQQGLLAQAAKVYRNQKAARAEWLEAQRQATQESVIGGRVWNSGALPEPYDDLFERCPVEQPRGFGDGFGAPRYGGGYHLHKGVDIVAPMGTKIIAPFDGYSYTSSNGLGGNVVRVVGQHGTVYNAHLSEYTGNSNGRVSAGEEIGLVGSTGYSSTPHDHFEFHPSAMPGPWPVSIYGYSVIEDAINPYPMLIQACG